ncbi:VOC family protein [Maribacter hydrothermalis]|uniref:Glyoxalase n=1 Tax=Maribacter hydrothermalis TaxID=1836467 RepID=A0A1B7Z8P3_9FLAO|nr:VOC family protein [Maribacter hydrothermalis]APQ18922.1 glyoxalase [Maribacter hydrothermalis]OBR39065.1 glyoxalase [Maribacter hydrothermalis]
MKKTILYLTVLFSFCILDCNGQDKTNAENTQLDSTETQNTNHMKSFISIFEIPATDISRAVDFYKAILDINIEKMEFPEMQMGVLPYEGQMVTGVIMKAEGYLPSANGVTIYLNGGDNLQTILDKVAQNGGEIMVPKSLHADESGYYAIFLDSEGNKMGLHSPN